MTKHQFLDGHQFYATTHETVYMFRKSAICGIGMVLIRNYTNWTYSCTVKKIDENNIYAFTSIMGAQVNLVIALKSLTCLTCQGGACKP